MPIREKWFPNQARPTCSQMDDAEKTKQRPIERWENEGGMIPKGQGNGSHDGSFHEARRSSRVACQVKLHSA